MVPIRSRRPGSDTGNTGIGFGGLDTLTGVGVPSSRRNETPTMATAEPSITQGTILPLSFIVGEAHSSVHITPGPNGTILPSDRRAKGGSSSVTGAEVDDVNGARISAMRIAVLVRIFPSFHIVF